MSTLLLQIVAIVAGVAAIPTDPSRQMDFWVGDWICTGELHNPNGTTTKTEATNSITREFKNKVLHEHFSMNGMIGMSVSVFNPSRKIWQQTWVDDSGSYIALEGSSDGKSVTLSTKPTAIHPKGFNRMVFHDIKLDQFDWDWESTRDGGKTWQIQWHLHYSRKAT